MNDDIESEFRLITGRKPDTGSALRETVEQVLLMTRENGTQETWSLPAIGEKVWDSFPEHVQGIVLGQLLNAYVLEVYWNLVRQQRLPSAPSIH